MGDIVKLAVRLFVFALVAAVALGLTNEVTKGPIAEQALAAQMEALNKVLPGSEYAEIAYEELADGTVLEQIFVGTNEAGEIDGYALTAAPNGYGGPIPITIGVSTAGHVTQVYVGSLQETAGLGTRVGTDEFMDKFIAIAADPATLRDDVQTLSGATISSTAFLNAVEEMLTYTRDTLGIEPAAGDREAVIAAYMAANSDGSEEIELVVTTGSYDVTGFGDFTVEIAVDSEGKIVSVTVPEHNETPGFGADLIADTAVFEALVGQDIATAQIDVKAGATLTSNAINEALAMAANGGSEGGAATYDVTGFGPFTVAIELDGDGKIVSVGVTEHNETPGFGADLIADEAVFEALVGQDIAVAQIDIKAGATLTSNAINDALAQAAAAAGGEVAAAPAIPGDPYTVKGMNKFTLYVEVEDGKIVSVTAAEHNETPGFGADILTEEALGALVGMDLAQAQVDIKSGVTLTSEAINAALKQAAAANGIALPEPVVEVEEPEAEVEEPEAEVEVEEPVAEVEEPVAEAEEPAAEEPAAEEPAQESAGSEPVVVEVTGFQPFKVAVAADNLGTITSVEVIEHNETPGFGADLIADTAVFEALIGQHVAEAQIDVKAGATLTSNAINEALQKAAEATPVILPLLGDDAVAIAVPEETEKTEEPAAEAAEPVAYNVKGFAEFAVEIAVDTDGKIVSVTVGEHGETPGFGADLIADEAVFEALIGQDIATAQIDVKSGVTLTSNAINDALAQAAAAQAGGAGTVAAIDVTGFADFTVEIEVDADGKIVSVTVGEHGETPGFGADLIADTAVFEALIGQDIATAQIDVKAGVTLTSNAINEALAQAAKEVQ